MGVSWFATLTKSEVDSFPFNFDALDRKRKKSQSRLLNIELKPTYVESVSEGEPDFPNKTIWIQLY